MSQMKITENQAIAAYKEMLLIRRFEERCGQEYSMGAIGGFCHLYIGQEAIIAATNLVKKNGDKTITAYRCHGHALASGLKPADVMAELMGKRSGSSKGKGGSMHIFNPKGGYYGGHGIVGAQIPLGTGMAFAEKYNNTNSICYSFMGDGAVHQGQVYEVFNMASLWNLPVLYIIENNGYAMGTSVGRSTKNTDLYNRGKEFGIAGASADAMDIESAYTALLNASEYVRSGKGPFLLELKTYRYRGHSVSDPAKYRSKEEVEKYKHLDTIEHLAQLMLDRKYINQKQLEAIQEDVKTAVAEALQLAKADSEPDSQELYTDVFVSA